MTTHRIQLKDASVEAAESGDEYFQVMFEELQNPDHYFLVQRGFEFEDKFAPSCYFECHDDTCNGHIQNANWNLSGNRFTCFYRLKSGKSIDVDIPIIITEEDLKKIQEYLRIIFVRIQKTKS